MGAPAASVIELKRGDHLAALIINPFSFFRRFLLIRKCLMPDKQSAARLRSQLKVNSFFYGSLTKRPLLSVSEHIVLFKVKTLT